MYRLTLSENASKHLSAQLPATSVRRVYRWGNLWGILQNGEWIVEERNQIQSEPYLLEEVKRLPVHAPPPAIDDVWEEECIQVGDMEYNGSLLSVCLPGAILKQWCAKQGLPVPVVSDSVFSVVPNKPVHATSLQTKPAQTKPQPHSKPQPQYQTKHHFKQSKPGTCYIVD